MDAIETPILQAPPEPDAAPTIMGMFPNFAEDADIVERAKKRLTSLFSACRDRSDIEDVWDKNDNMYRVKPDSALDTVNRANESTGVFHVSVNQLVSMAFKTFTDNADNYKFGFYAVPDDEQANIVRQANADIMTLLLRKAQRDSMFKRELKRILFNIYKYGTGFAGVPWEKRVIDLVYRDKATGERRNKPFIRANLPALESIPIDQVWLDPNIEDIERQPAVFIRSLVGWNDLLRDSQEMKVQLFRPDGEESVRDKFAKFRENVAASEFNTAASDRTDNASRSMDDRTTDLYRHWYVWVNLPVNTETGKWDEAGMDVRCRVRLVGDPDNCEIIEIRQNVFPGGIPLLVSHQTTDDIGMYPISLGEKVETYFDQICVAVNQLIDNRSKNVRRPIVYDPMRVDIEKYNFGHSGAIPCNGDIRSAFVELQIADMTGTIMNTIQYCELKVREIMNTTDAVMGMAMGGRTSASEYVGAKAAATTPIFSDMASIEDELIGGYMRKFAQYVHTFMTHEDIVSQIGPKGAEFQFDLADIYTVELRGVSEAMDKATKIQNLMQLFSMTPDIGIQSKIRVRIAESMGIENASELAAVPAKDQAVKAALWENNEMLVHGQWDAPMPGEMHDVHESVHLQGLWNAKRDKNPNAPLMEQHLAATQQLKRAEQASAGATPASGIGQPDGGTAALPGPTSGQEISAEFGNANAGSPIPAEPAAPAAM